MSEQPPTEAARSYDPLSYTEAAEAMNRMARVIRKLEKEHADSVDAAASSEAVYRKAISERIDFHRGEGLAVDQAVARARADCLVLSRERDEAEGKVRNVLERLHDRRGEREGLHRLVAWSHSIDIRTDDGNGPH